MSPISSYRLFAALMALVLVGCDSKGGHGNMASQVVAKVNNEEITVSQLNHEISQMGNLHEFDADAIKHRALEQLIDEQIALDEAIGQKLDRDPEVMQAIEAARRSILANVYLARLFLKSQPPTKDEARKFYEDNPALFAARRIFHLQQITIDATDHDSVDIATKLVGSTKSFEDLLNNLRSRNTRFELNTSTRPAEQLPLEFLHKYQIMKDGEITTLRDSNSVVIAHLISSQEEPIDETRAVPIISEFLKRQRNLVMAKSEMSRLREKSKVVYFGEFDPQKKIGAVPNSPTNQKTDIVTPDSAEKRQSGELGRHTQEASDGVQLVK